MTEKEFALLKPGDPVWWMFTEGGGGGSGHRPSKKVPVEAVVVGLTPFSVRVLPSDRGFPTWVSFKNVERRFASSLERAVYRAVVAQHSDVPTTTK